MTNSGIKTIGIVGTGQIGSRVAWLAVEAGYNVILSNSRGAETLQELVAALGPNAKAATSSEAAKQSDLIVLSTPLKAVKTLIPNDFANKIVIDTTNYYPARDGNIALLDDRVMTSSEMNQSYLNASTIVKIFNCISSPQVYLNAKKDKAKRTCIPISGNSKEANSKMIDFLETIGYEALDIGTLSESWRQEPGTTLYGVPFFPHMPDTVTDVEEQKQFCIRTAAKPISRDELKKVVENVKVPPRVGGFLEDFPKFFSALLMDIATGKIRL